MLDNQKAKNKHDQYNSLYGYLAVFGIIIGGLVLIKFKNKIKPAADTLEISKLVGNIQETNISQVPSNNTKTIEKAIETLTKNLENAIEVIKKNKLDMSNSITPELHKVNLNKNFAEIDKLVNSLKNQIDQYLKIAGNDFKWTTVVSDTNHFINRANYFSKMYSDIKLAGN